MRCPRCRVDNSDTANYCRGCGMPLRRQPPSWASAAPSKSPPPVPSEPTSPYPPDDVDSMEVPEGVRYFDPPPAEHATPSYLPSQGYAPPQSPAMMEYAVQRYSAYAGFWLRFVAYIVDSIILAIGSGCVGAMIGGIIGFSFAAAGYSQSQLEFAAELGGYVIGVVMGWLYYAMMESSEYQATLGKMALGLRVTDMDGRRVSFARATGRHFGKIVSFITLLIGYIMAGFTEKKQALHDIMAECLVVRKTSY